MPNIHPLLVHFPIALAFVILAMDLIGVLFKRPSFIDAGTKVSVFAALGAAAAVISGLIAEESVSVPDIAHDLFETHEALGFAFLGVIIVAAIFRLAMGKKLRERLTWIAVTLSFVASAIVGVGGYIGGELVFKYHVGHQIQAAGGSETLIPNSDKDAHDDDHGGHSGRDH
jgi:uncharacterized membrane protein